jgi:acetyl-CoA C-acetyltransferase
MLAGGMESMSNIPHYLTVSRSGIALGHTQLIDGCIHDGLWDPYDNQHMGMCAENVLEIFHLVVRIKMRILWRVLVGAQAAVDSNVFEEIVPVEVPQRRGDPTLVDKDEEPHALKLDKLATLRPAFDPKNGSVTAANASSLNDGAVALVLMTEDDAKARNIVPLARILGYGDAERSPVDFTIAPSLAVPVALANAGIMAQDVDYHEINEAFAVVALANMSLMGLDHSTVNVFGGAVALGHPIGMSGARIIGTLCDVLKQKDGTIGCASICNGGGGASAIVIERLS